MLNQPVSLDALEGVILDFGGVLYDIDYDAPPKAFAALGDADFASLYHQASQSTWFDELETGKLDRTTFYGHLLKRCAPGTKARGVQNVRSYHAGPRKPSSSGSCSFHDAGTDIVVDFEAGKPV